MLASNSSKDASSIRERILTKKINRALGYLSQFNFVWRQWTIDRHLLNILLRVTNVNGSHCRMTSEFLSTLFTGFSFSFLPWKQFRNVKSLKKIDKKQQNDLLSPFASNVFLSIFFTIHLQHEDYIAKFLRNIYITFYRNR